ncbi:DoxX family membrane protein [Amycolatopsis anabasis]|uniref:DoxX family membrane protein n=1 Tax=Amycolatopsis anabasis TaxID=1840409 RepID=UPI00131CF4BE|nr:DoxX family membrane protein [Amycolatopsis anabasis]
MILRRVARPLLASIFIFGGIGALRDSEGHAQAAKPLIDKTLGPRAGSLPDAVPTDPVTLIRIDGLVKIGAGTALAFGKAPRLASLALLGSLVPTTLAGHAFWEKQEPADRQEQLIHFLKNAGLAGGLLLAAGDTGGKPSLGWRARRAAKKAGKQVQESTGHARRRTVFLAGRASKAVESALPG